MWPSWSQSTSNKCTKIWGNRESQNHHKWSCKIPQVVTSWILQKIIQGSHQASQWPIATFASASITRTGDRTNIYLSKSHQALSQIGRGDNLSNNKDHLVVNLPARRIFVDQLLSDTSLIFSSFINDMFIAKIQSFDAIDPIQSPEATSAERNVSPSLVSKATSNWYPPDSTLTSFDLHSLWIDSLLVPFRLYWINEVIHLRKVMSETWICESTGHCINHTYECIHLHNHLLPGIMLSYMRSNRMLWVLKFQHQILEQLLPDWRSCTFERLC